MVELNIVKVIALITILISSLLVFFLLTVKAKSKLPNLLLAGFIVFCSIDIIGLFINQHIYFYLFSKTFTFLIFPTLFLYVLSICRVDFKLTLKSLLHLMPFIVYLLILIYKYLSKTYYESNLIIEILNKLIWTFNAILLKLQALLYISITIYILRKHKKIYLENYTGGNIVIYKLLSQIILIFVITFPVTIAKEILSFTVFHETLKWLNLVLIALALFMVCFFILKALFNPKLFRSVDFKIQTIDKINKNSNHKIEDTLEWNIAIEQLRQYMIEQEPYLNSELTLQELSSQLNISSRKLTLIINKHLGQHFFDFVNQYRIIKAKEYLQNLSNSNLTIQQVFYDVGFNSKSSFNTAFKKYTGITPTEFKNKFL